MGLTLNPDYGSLNQIFSGNRIYAYGRIKGKKVEVGEYVSGKSFYPYIRVKSNNKTDYYLNLFRSIFHSNKIKLSNEEFDKKYKIITSDVRIAMKLLSYPFQSKVLEIKPRKLRITKKGVKIIFNSFKDKEVFEKAINFAISIIEWKKNLIR
jgi:hypothetical protein